MNSWDYSRAKIALMSTSKSYHRIVFMGSPEFALPSLAALHQHHHLVGVVTQPDRPSGRGRQLQAPPIKQLATSLEIPVIQPVRLKDASTLQQLADWNPDLIVVAAYGQILRKNVLTLPKHGCINVHASLLPRWRGAAPIQAAILAGDSKSGISIMQMDAGLDTGPILSQKSTPLASDETAASLSEKLSPLGANLLIESLPDFFAGKLEAVKQDDELSSYATMLKKSDGELDFNESADFLARKVRAFFPWPGTFAIINDQSLKIHIASSLTSSDASPGQLAIKNNFPAIGTSAGYLLLEQLQPPGKKAMSGADFLRGGRTWQGYVTPHSSKETT